MTDIFSRAEMWKRHEAIAKANQSREAEKAAFTQLHRDYYGAYVREFNIKAPQSLVLACRKALAAGDTNFNSPFTRLDAWDAAQGSTRGRHDLMVALHENGEGWSLSTNICLLKEAMRQQLDAESKP